MSTLDVNELSKSVDAFKRTVDTLAQIKEISTSLQDAAKEVHTAASEMSSDAGTIASAAAKVDTAAADLSKKAEELSEEIRQSIKEQEAVTEAKAKECIDSVAGAVATVVDETKALRDQVQEYAIGTSKSVDELRLLSSSNAREVREKISDTEDHIRSDMDRRFKDVESLMGEVSSLKAAVGKLQTISTVGCVAAAIAAIIAAISFFI